MIRKGIVPILLISVIILGGFFTVSGFGRQFYKKLDFKAVSKTNVSNPMSAVKYIACELTSAMGVYTVNMNLNIACENDNQHQQLQRALSGIKSDMVIQLSSAGMEESISQRNFNDIKYRMLRIVNRYCAKPVENIYLNKFIYY